MLSHGRGYKILIYVYSYTVCCCLSYTIIEMTISISSKKFMGKKSERIKVSDQN